jgi:hypothetical protein
VPNFEPPPESNSSQREQPPPISTFRRLLLTVCQHEFDNRANYALPATGTAAAALQPPDLEYTKQIAKKKMLGNVKFIGELGKLELLSRAILHKCTRTLLAKQANETYAQMNDDLECLCKLLTTVGRRMDEGEARKLMDQYFERMRKLRLVGREHGYAMSKCDCLPPRIRFMIQDVLDLRANQWVAVRVAQRQEQAQPKTINELRVSLGESENAKFASTASTNQAANAANQAGQGMLGNSAFMINMLQQFSQQPNMSLLNAINTMATSKKQGEGPAAASNYYSMVSPNYYAEDEFLDDEYGDLPQPSPAPTPPAPDTSDHTGLNRSANLNTSRVSKTNLSPMAVVDSPQQQQQPQRPLSNESAMNSSLSSSFNTSGGGGTMVRTNGRKQTVLHNFNDAVESGKAPHHSSGNQGQQPYQNQRAVVGAVQGQFNQQQQQQQQDSSSSNLHFRSNRSEGAGNGSRGSGGHFNQNQNVVSGNRNFADSLQQPPQQQQQQLPAQKQAQFENNNSKLILI